MEVNTENKPHIPLSCFYLHLGGEICYGVDKWRKVSFSVFIISSVPRSTFFRAHRVLLCLFLVPMNPVFCRKWALPFSMFFLCAHYFLKNSCLSFFVENTYICLINKKKSMCYLFLHNEIYYLCKADDLILITFNFRLDGVE